MRAPILIGAAEAALYTGRPYGTLRRWVYEGRVSRYGTGRRARYDLRELPPAEDPSVPPRRIEPVA